jgi:uncharacterized protein
MHYLLFYELVDDYLTRRGEFRPEHLTKGWQAVERGELVVGGALTGPADTAVLLFKGNSPEVAEKFASNDPYVLHGLVRRWYVREWMTVVGDLATNPVRPDAAAKSS